MAGLGKREREFFGEEEIEVGRRKLAGLLFKNLEEVKSVSILIKSGSKRLGLMIASCARLETKGEVACATKR